MFIKFFRQFWSTTIVSIFILTSFFVAPISVIAANDKANENSDKLVQEENKDTKEEEKAEDKAAKEEEKATKKEEKQTEQPPAEEPEAAEPVEEEPEESEETTEEEVVEETPAETEENEEEQTEEIETQTQIENKKVTFSPIKVDTEYVYPFNKDVRITFAELDETVKKPYLSIEEVDVVFEDELVTGYEFLTNMNNGEFEYDLTLPNPFSDFGVEVQYTENQKDFTPVDLKAKGKQIIYLENLDHFTIFVVTFEDEQDPAPTTPGYNDEWFDYPGPVTRVSSGNNGIASSEGGYHAEIAGGAYTRWDGYNSTFPSLGYDTRIDVYLDMGLATGSNDLRFDFTSAINDTGGSHRRDFIIHLGTNPTVANQWLASASNNTPGWPGNPGRNPADITETGWYTIEHSFRKNALGELEVTISLYKKDSGNLVGTWLLSDPTDIIGTTVGGNRYGWIMNIGTPFLAVDNTEYEEYVDEAIQINILKPETVGKYYKGEGVLTLEAEFINDYNFSGIYIDLIDPDEPPGSSTLARCSWNGSYAPDVYTCDIDMDAPLNISGTMIEEKNYKAKFTGFQSAGVGPTSQNLTIHRDLYIDNMAPVVTVDSLLTNDPHPPLTGTVDDDTATIEVTVNGVSYSNVINGAGTITISGSGPNFVWTLADGTINPQLGEGVYDVSVSAEDSAGNVGTDGTDNELEIDRTNPDVTDYKLEVSTDGGTTWTEKYVVKPGDLVRAMVKTTDASGIREVDFRPKGLGSGWIDSQSIVTALDASGYYVYEFEIPVDGEYTDTHAPITEGVDEQTAWFRVQDNAGNYSDPHNGINILFTFDNTAPTVVAITSAEADPTNTNPFEITITFSEEITNFDLSDIIVGNGSADNLQTVDNITFTADITPTADGELTVDIGAGACEDLAGIPNEAATQYSLTYDGSYPEMNNIKMFVDGVETTFAKPGDTVRITADVTDNIAGVDRVQIWVRENPWNPNNNSLTSGIMTHVSGDEYEFVFVVPDTYTDGDPLNELVDGNYFNFRPWDNLGNSHIGWKTTYTIDATAPEISLVLNEYRPSSGHYYPHFTQSTDLNFAKPDSDDSRYYMSGYKYEGLTYSDLSVAQDATSNIVSVEYRYSTDEGGTWSGWTNADPVDGAFDSKMEEFSYNLTVSPNGGYLFEARTTDEVGLQATDQFEVYVDTLNPSVHPDVGFTEATPEDGAFVTDGFTISTYCDGTMSEDNDRLHTVNIAFMKDWSNFIDRYDDNVNVDAGNQELVISDATINSLDDGEYTIWMRCADKAQNSYTESRTVIIDNTAPTTPTWTDQPIFTHNGYDGNRIEMTFNESTDTNGIQQYQYQFVRRNLEGDTVLGSNTNVTMNGLSCTGGICTWTPNAQQDSQWIFRMRAIDNAGNTSDWSNWDDATDAEFTSFGFDYDNYANGTGIFARADYDTTAGNASFVVKEDNLPVSEITNPDTSANPHYTNQPTIDIDYTSNDEDTDIKNVKLYVSTDAGASFSEVATNTNTNGTFTYNFPAEGEYCFHTIAEDIADDQRDDNSAGNMEAGKGCELEVIYDATAPTIPGDLTFTSADGSVDFGCNGYTNEYSIITQWSDSTDAMSGVDYYEYQSYNPPDGWVWGSAIVDDSQRAGSFTIGEGVYGFRVRAVDVAGNVSDWTAINFDGSCQITYDITAPTIDLLDIIIDEGQPIPDADDFVATYSDPYTCTYLTTPVSRVDQPAASEVYTDIVECTSTDLAGNTTTKTANLAVVNVIPTVSITDNGTTLTANPNSGNPDISIPTGYTYSWTCDGVSYGSSSSTTRPTTYGTHTCSVTVTDVDGDTATTSTTYTIPTPPTPPAPTNEEENPTIANFDECVLEGGSVNQETTPRECTYEEEVFIEEVETEITVTNFDECVLEGGSVNQETTPRECTYEEEVFIEEVETEEEPEGEVAGATEKVDQEDSCEDEDKFPWWIVITLAITLLAMLTATLLKQEEGKKEDEKEDWYV